MVDVFELRFAKAYVYGWEDYSEALLLAKQKDREAAEGLLDSIFRLEKNKKDKRQDKGLKGSW
jgi:hypothetical protein